MTEINDVSYTKVYQQVTKNFIIPESQQRPGDMKGTMTATSLLVQTHSELTFTLTPSMNLSNDAYFVVNIPTSLTFQGPSCTVTNKVGFSRLMSCSRVAHQATLYNPFDSGYDTTSASELQMTLHEFLLPTSVQDLGVIEVISYDFDANNETRAVDMFESKDLWSISGPIIKLDEV